MVFCLIFIITYNVKFLRRTKIIATLGPSSSSEDIIRKLVIAGANVFRLNFSHGNLENHKQNAQYIRKIEQELNTNIAIMMDLQGPKLRIGVFEKGNVNLNVGSVFVLDQEQELGTTNRVTFPHPEIYSAITEGTELLLDDGKIKLLVKERNGKSIITEVINGGVLSNRKGVNIPNAILPIKALTAKDLKDIEAANDVDADWIAVSFVQTAKDIEYARSIVGNKFGIIAKIEKPSAVQNIDSILKVSDAIMVARGDLGVELPFESIPSIQKELIEKAKEHQRPVVVATQMLESMTNCHVPTRAEITDVACAVAEGADAVMLSAESASGNYPVEAVSTMAKIIQKTEDDELTFVGRLTQNIDAIQQSVYSAVTSAKIRTIASFTESGRCAISTSNTRAQANIIAFTPNVKTMRRLSLVWGVKPILIDEIFSFSQMVQLTQRHLCKNFKMEQGEKVAIVAGLPFRSSGITNLIHIYEIDTERAIES